MKKRKLFLSTLVLLFGIFACNTSTPAQIAPIDTIPDTIPTNTMAAIAEPTYLPILPTRSSIPQDEASIPRVELDQAVTAFTGGEAIIVDVRTPDAYALSHIAGSINIPLGTIETEPNRIDIAKDQWIITYCT